LPGLIRSFRRDFDRLVEKQPESPALITKSDIESTITSYEELSALIDRCLALFEERSLKPGDVVLALMPNAAETLVCWLATIKGGLGFAPLPCTATPAEVRRWIGLVKPRLAIGTRLVREETIAVMNESESEVVLIETDSRYTWLPTARLERSFGDEPRTFLASSGTTGEPQAMVLDSNRLWSSGCAFMKFHGLQEPELRFWNYLPMSYLGGLFNLGLIPLCVGGSTVIDDPFSGKTFLGYWQSVDRFDVNAIWLVPSILRGLVTMLERLRVAERTGRPGKNIRVAFLGTAPIDLASKRRFEELAGVSVLENFALSETTFFTSETRDNLGERVEGSVGEVLPYADLKFVPASDVDDSNDKPPTEIHVRSPFLFLGYLEEDGLLYKPFDEEGYMATGDLGSLTDSNQLKIEGRTRDIIKKGGYLVSLREVEIIARRHDAVAEAAAVKTSHPFYGESFTLCVELREGLDRDVLQDVARYVRGCLVNYKWPEKVVAVDELPRTASGKIRKHLIDVSGDSREGGR